MAQALTVSMTNPYADLSDPNKIILDWTSDADGNVSKDICSTYTTAGNVYRDVLPVKLKGYVVSIETIPGEEGDLSTDLPTDAYDITLLDPYSYDIAGGNLADLAGGVNKAAELYTPDPSTWIDSEITLTIANAGDSKKGRVIINMDVI